MGGGSQGPAGGSGTAGFRTFNEERDGGEGHRVILERGLSFREHSTTMVLPCPGQGERMRKFQEDTSLPGLRAYPLDIIGLSSRSAVQGAGQDLVKGLY